MNPWDAHNIPTHNHTLNNIYNLMEVFSSVQLFNNHYAKTNNLCVALKII